MPTSQILGIFTVTIAGLIMGSEGWPIKLMKKLRFEHWWFIGMLVGLVIIPWVVTIAFCPNAFQAYAGVPVKTLLIANLWAFGWGIANVLYGVCFTRIGIGLTGAIVTGLGVSVGVTFPMVIKGSGSFKDAANIDSSAGLTILLGVGVMLAGVVLAAIAGFGRDHALKKQEITTGNILTGLTMAAAAGLLSAGFALSFVYGQGPIVSAMKANGAGDIPATFAVWAVALMSGALINLIYPAYLMTRNKSWGVFREGWKESLLASIIGINYAVGNVLVGSGMLLLGALGASIGFGIQQASQMIGSQGTGFISGEWHGVRGRPRYQMYLAIALLVTAAAIMAYGNRLSKG